MCLNWIVDHDKYYFFDHYEMKCSLIKIQLMKEKKTNLVHSNTVLMQDTPIMHFDNVNGLDIEDAKYEVIKTFLSHADFLFIDVRNKHLPTKELQENINYFNQTLIQYTVKNYIKNNPDKLEGARQIVDDPLAPDEYHV